MTTFSLEYSNQSSTLNLPNSTNLANVTFKNINNNLSTLPTPNNKVNGDYKIVKSRLNTLPFFTDKVGGDVYNLLFSPILGLSSILGTGQYTITGIVKDRNLLFAYRRVMAIDRENGFLLDSTYSNATNGEFVLKVPHKKCIVICLPEPEEGVNAEIYDMIMPI